MKITNLYNNLKERFTNYFFPIPTNDSKKYFISGISPQILSNYQISYSPNKTKFIQDKNGTKPEKNLETKLEKIDFDLTNLKNNSDSISYLIKLKKSMKEIHYQNMKKIRAAHLNSLGKIYSTTIEKINKTVSDVKEYIFENISGGGVRLSFVQK